MQESHTLSYCVFSFNQSKYIIDCINSVLWQNCSPLEIIISDDCSTDNTYDKICNIVNEYKGPHKIIKNRNEINLGIGGHVSKCCCDIASGKNIVTLAGDDILEPNHARVVLEAIAKYPDIYMIDFNGIMIDENDKYVKCVDSDATNMKYSLCDYIQNKYIKTFAPGRVFKKDIFDKFGKINSSCPTEDSVIVLRALMCSRIMRLNKNIVKYRIHSNNISRSNNIRKLCIEDIVRQYRDDIRLAYNKQYINGITHNVLIRRIQLEQIKRKFNNYSALNFVIMKRIYAFLLKLYVIYYDRYVRKKTPII